MAAELEPISGSVRLSQAGGRASPATRVMFFSDQACRILQQWIQQLPSLVNYDWFPPTGSSEVAVPIEIQEATRIFEALAKDLVSAAVNVIVDPSRAPEKSAASDVALLSFFLGQKIGTLYQAAICYLILTPEAIDLRGARPDKSGVALPDDQRLKVLLSRFGKSVESLPPKAFGEWGPETIRQCAKDAIKRATEISAMTDPNNRAREAIWAAAEMQALLRSELGNVQTRVARRLARSLMWYLAEDVETLVLAQEPAFYCAMQLPQLSKPALDVVSFFKTPDLTQGAIEEGPVSLEARR